MLIKPEAAGDEGEIRQLNSVAFDGRAEEADLVDDLRGAGDLVLSLTARTEDGIVGHVAFSRVTIDAPSGPAPGVALAPIAVHPELQNRGVGADLIRTGLRLLTDQGELVVFVVGNPTYYTRFGFSVEQGREFPCAYSGPYFMALVLDDTVEVPRGRVTYPDAFELVN